VFIYERRETQNATDVCSFLSCVKDSDVRLFRFRQRPRDVFLAVLAQLCCKFVVIGVAHRRVKRRLQQRDFACVTTRVASKCRAKGEPMRTKNGEQHSVPIDFRKSFSTTESGLSVNSAECKDKRSAHAIISNSTLTCTEVDERKLQEHFFSFSNKCETTAQLHTNRCSSTCGSSS
jgi:hypothetical protein